MFDAEPSRAEQQPPSDSSGQARIERGFLLATLLSADLELTGRWEYLTDCWESGTLPEAPIPPIHFLGAPDKTAWKMLTATLDSIPRHGSSWQR